MDNTTIRILNYVTHRTFQRGASKFFIIYQDGSMPVSSLCWFFCWAKTGMGSEKAMIQVRSIFDIIFKKSFSYYDRIIDHEKARKIRYIEHNKCSLGYF